MALSKIDVANMLTGTAPVANGGTGVTTSANIGNLVLLQDKVSASSVANVEMDLSSDYNYFKLVIHSAEAATDGTQLTAVLSINGGTSFESGASDYTRINQIYTAQNTSTQNYSNKGSSNIPLSGGFGNQSDENGCGEMFIYPKRDTGSDHFGNFVTANFMGQNSSDQVRWYNTMAQLVSSQTTAVDAIRLNFTSGNIAKITYSLYGFKS